MVSEVPACQNCGRELPAGDKFCPGCGAPVVPGAAPPAPPVPGIQPPQPPSPVLQGKKGMSSGAKVAIILGVVAVLLIITAVVMFVVFFANVISGPADTANGYTQALNDGDFSTAWGYLSTEAQDEEGGLSEFRSKFGVLEGEIEKWFTSGVSIENNRAQVDMDLTFSDGTEATWDIYLLKEGGSWKIVRIST